MKISFVLIFALVLQLSATTYSQSTNIDLNVNNMKVKDVLRVIESKTNFRFFYNDDLTELDRSLSLTATGENINTLLGKIFSGSTVSFRILDTNVVVIAPAANLQQQKITGKVTDATTGEALVGVTILIEGTTQGTTTDTDGKYSLDLPNPNSNLVFSYIGYNNERIELSGQTTIDISLIPDIQSLEEVVVIGYGTVKKRDLTGSVVSIKNEDITSTPTGNAMNALQGKVVGMDIMKSTGKAGSSVDITVRGNRSIYGSNAPLFIIDGFEGSYANLNPSDIESIDILKDASSTAIYGSAGANGVIIITTKQAKEGKTSINFDAYVGYNGFAKYPNGMTGYEYTKLKREAYRGQHGNYPEFMSDVITSQEQYTAYNDGKWINYVDKLFRTGIEQNYNLSISRGSEKTKTYLSLNYYDEEGLLRNDAYKKYVVKSNTEHQITDWLKTDINLQFTHTDNDQRAQNVFGNSLTAVPFGDFYDANGNINYTPVSGVTNPLADEIANQYVNNTIGNYFTGNGLIEIKLLKGLSYKSTLGATLSSSRAGRYFGSKSIANVEAGFSVPTAVIDNGLVYNYKWENIINYNLTVANDHSFVFTGVTSWAKNQQETSYAAGSGYDMDSYSFYNLSGATSKQTIKSSYTRTQIMSLTARVNYNFRGKYLLSISNRWDGVSHLSEGHKWDNFPSVAVAWRISDEPFLGNIEAITNLKLRVGYGITGNSGGVTAYATQAGMFNAAKPVGFGETAAPAYIFNQLLGNDGLGWEKSYNTNIGVDAGFLNNHITVALDVYNTDTKDVLYSRNMPASMGGSWGSPFKMWQNIGETNNKGIELQVNTINYKTKKFTWNTTFTFSANKEKITSLPGGKDLINEKLFLNQPIKSFYDYKYLGIWQQNEASEAAKYNCVPGDIKLQTDGSFSETGLHTYNKTTDNFILGSATPDWIAGIQNSFTYRGFDASIFVMARWGQMIQDNTITRYNPAVDASNSPKGSDYWTPENPGGYLPRPGIHNSSSNYIGFSSLAFVDGSYIKVKNITIGYSLPMALIQKIKLEKLRFYATTHNPFIFAKSSLLKDKDPEGQGSDNFPLTRQFVFGLNLTF